MQNLQLIILGFLVALVWLIVLPLAVLLIFFRFIALFRGDWIWLIPPLSVLLCNVLSVLKFGSGKWFYWFLAGQLIFIALFLYWFLPIFQESQKFI